MNQVSAVSSVIAAVFEPSGSLAHPKKTFLPGLMAAHGTSFLFVVYDQRFVCLAGPRCCMQGVSRLRPVTMTTLHCKHRGQDSLDTLYVKIWKDIRLPGRAHSGWNCETSCLRLCIFWSQKLQRGQ